MRILISAAVATALLSGCVGTSGGGLFSASAVPNGFQEAYESAKREDYVKAERMLAEILENDPNEPFANLGMGYVMHSTGRENLARPFYDRAVTYGETAYPDRFFILEDHEHPASRAPEESIADFARRNIEALEESDAS